MANDTTQSAAPPEGEAKRESTAPARRASRWLRLGVLGGILIAITAIGIAHQRGVRVVGVDALCPFGGIESLWALIATGTTLQRIAASSVILFAGVVLVAVVFRRAFCGYICPLGAVQELVGTLGRKLFGHRRPEVPKGLDRVARYLKYVVLAGFTVWTWQAATLVIRPYDPWVAYMHLTSTELWAEFAVGAVVLGVSLVGSLVYERFFCKYACPMGAFLAIASPLSVFKVRRNESACTSCGSCDAACPVNIEVSTAATVNDPECINCNECVNVCPSKGALGVAAPGSEATRRVLKPNAVLLGTGAILGVVIGATTLAGSFAWTMPSAAEALREGTPSATSTVGAAGTTSATGAADSGETPSATIRAINVEQIKGSMTFAEISEASGIPAAAFQKRFGIAEADMHTPIKDLAGAHGFDVHTDVREWVKEQTAGASGR